MLKKELLEWLAQGEHSGVELKWGDFLIGVIHCSLKNRQLSSKHGQDDHLSAQNPADAHAGAGHVFQESLRHGAVRL